MQPIIFAHDKFFKQMMSDHRIAKEFFEVHLPVNIRQLVDLDSIQLRKESYIDQQLKLSITDMLFSAQFVDKPGYLYLLAEHQSTPDREMAFRLLKYTVQIMDQHRKETQTETLPIVYPIVFYHGRAEYRYSTDIFDLFDDPKLAKQVLFKPFQLIDIARIPDEKLQEHVWLSVLELCAKHIFARDILPHLQQLWAPLQTLAQSGAEDIVQATVTYLMAEGQIESEQAFVAAITKEAAQIGGEKFMTIAELFESKGLARGKIEGKAEGAKKTKQAVALQCLQENLSLELISKVTGLSIDEIQMLKNIETV